MTEQLIFAVRLLAAGAFGVLGLMAWIREDWVSAILSVLAGGAWIYYSFEEEFAGWPSLILLVFLARIIEVYSRGLK